jgi:MarR family transcriptional regulator for hemolysin
MPHTPVQDNPDINFGFLVSDVARLLREKFNATAQKLGLTLAQARVLAHLSRNEGISQVALSAILEVQPITLLRQIDRLEKSGFVERRVHPTDRRMQQLYLTPLSQPLLQQIFNVGSNLHGQVMAGLSEAERSQLVTALAHVRCNLSQPPRGGESEPPVTSAREIGDV